MNPTTARSVNWSPVNEYVQRCINRVGSYPMVGSSEWCALSDNDPAKIAAIFDAAQHWALHLELAQRARCDASKAIAASEDWGATGLRNQQRQQMLSEKPWMRRRLAS